MTTILSNTQFYCIVMVNNQTGDITGVVTQTASGSYTIESSMYRMFISRLKKPLEQAMAQLVPYNDHHFEIHKVKIADKG